MAQYKFKDENNNWQRLVQDVKVNDLSVFDGKDANIDLKTINNESLIGTSNISLQEQLISGTNIKTINGESILGGGDIDVSSMQVKYLDYSTFVSEQPSQEDLEDIIENEYNYICVHAEEQGSEYDMWFELSMYYLWSGLKYKTFSVVRTIGDYIITWMFTKEGENPTTFASDDLNLRPTFTVYHDNSLTGTGTSGNQLAVNRSLFATSSQGQKADTALQPSAIKKKTLTNASSNYSVSSNVVTVTDADVTTTNNVELYPTDTTTETWLQNNLSSCIITQANGSFSFNITDNLPSTFSMYYIITEVS